MCVCSLLMLKRFRAISPVGCDFFDFNSRLVFSSRLAQGLYMLPKVVKIKKQAVPLRMRDWRTSFDHEN